MLKIKFRFCFQQIFKIADYEMELIKRTTRIRQLEAEVEDLKKKELDRNQILFPPINIQVIFIIEKFFDF